MAALSRTLKQHAIALTDGLGAQCITQFELGGTSGIRDMGGMGRGRGRGRGRGHGHWTGGQRASESSISHAMPCHTQTHAASAAMPVAHLRRTLTRTISGDP
ncbi:hypothetical protein PT974_09807 [Cladobotryum mycophilum]|uniref:Uncharacterized protein n=1 Tax=Cladobotryum mycophilum TaxID=491253 RepID=A0ABR0SH79_9HYPO